eukprot:621429-Hanusia_phi.AAC.2
MMPVNDSYSYVLCTEILYQCLYRDRTVSDRAALGTACAPRLKPLNMPSWHDCLFLARYLGESYGGRGRETSRAVRG